MIRRRVLVGWLALLIAPLAVAQPDSIQPDAQEIVRRSLALWRQNLDAARNYTFQERRVEQELNKNGTPTKTEIKTYEISMIFGERYAKLIARNDQPLSTEDQEKEQEKLNKFFEKQKNKSAAERERDRKKETDKFQREIADELPLILNYEVVGEQVIDGKPVWVLSMTPKADAHPKSRAAKLLAKVRGTVWISKADYQWVRAVADIVDDFSVGWFLFKLHKGTHVEFEQTHVNDEVWLPKRFFLQGSGRLTVKTARFRNETEFSKYQKFTTDVKITGVAEETAPDR